MAEGKSITADTGAAGGVVVKVGSTQAAHADAELLRVAHSIGPTSREGTAVVQAFGDGRLVAQGTVAAVGGLGVGNSEDADTLGDVVKKMEVFDAAGNSVGFVPIYDEITLEE